MSVGIIFPGQGSQAVGMLAGLGGDDQQVRKAIFGAASEQLQFDVLALVDEGPVEALNQTKITQPVLLAANHIMWTLWSQHHPTDRPRAVAGHSLGEFNALVAAEVIDFEVALGLVALRGELMQSAVASGEGAMAAILGLPDDVVEAICREVAEGEVVAPANYNSPGQLVIAGHATAVERAMLQCTVAGAKKTVLLPVSVPSHCPLMASAAEAFEAHLADLAFNEPKFPLVQNVNAESVADAAEIKQGLVEQLASPVLWTQSVKTLRTLGCDRLVECGPGRVLTGLGRRIDAEIEWVAYERELVT